MIVIEGRNLDVNICCTTDVAEPTGQALKDIPVTYPGHRAGLPKSKRKSKLRTGQGWLL